MGGKLITHYGFSEKRLEKSQYLELVNKISEVFNKNLINKHRHGDIPYIKNKKTFGDIDYLFEDKGDINYFDFINANFKTKFVHKNSNVYTFEQDGFQIDLILTQPEYYDFSRYYFGYNDCVGNLIGRFFHKMGMCLGHRGLTYRVRESLFSGIDKQKDNQIDEIVLTYEPRKAWGMLEFDLNRVDEGFKTIEEVFDWVINCKYFNSEIFAYSNLNHINRTRNKKRENYAGFLKYLEGKTFNNYPYLADKSLYLPFIHEHFPNFKNDLEKSREKYLKSKEKAEKFNGKLVMRWLNIEGGEELGRIIHSYKKSKENFDLFLEENSKEEIYKNFLTFHENML